MKRTEIWKPDILLTNSMDDFTDLGSENVLVTVDSNGLGILGPGDRFKTVCSLDINSYPFDSQECCLKFSTWMHSDNIVTFMSVIDEIFFKNFEENGEWRIISSKIESIILQLDGYRLQSGP